MEKKTLRRLLSFVLCMILLGICLVCTTVSGAKVPGQQAAEVWRQGEMPYRQLSVFLNREQNFGSDMISRIEGGIYAALSEESIAPERENARLWIDCYAGEMTVSAQHDEKSATCRAIFTGGDYFLLNEPDMLTGWYYAGDDETIDGIVLDKEAAWALFGGTELTGMTVTVDGMQCTIVGVSDTPADNPMRDAYGTEPTIYLPYELLTRMGKECAITYYGAVLPNPVRGYAKSLLTDKSGLGEGTYELAENTGRFSLGRNLSRLADFGSRSQRTSGIYYPWLENAAVYAEDVCTLFTFLAVLFAVWPVIFIIINIAFVCKNRKKLFGKGKKRKDTITRNFGGTL